jgi:hypothetical protein
MNLSFITNTKVVIVIIDNDGTAMLKTAGREEQPNPRKQVYIRTNAHRKLI